MRSTTRRPLDNSIVPILEIAADLVGGTVAPDAYQRIVAGIRRVIPCDSIVMLRLQGDSLVPVASEGLVPEAASQRFVIAEHPRLAQILRVRRPVRIDDELLPDPFDGLIAADQPLGRVHACMGCTLVVNGELLGVLAVDALDPHAFDAIDDELVAAVAGLAAAAMRASDLIDQLGREAARADRVARDLVRDTTTRAGGELLGQSTSIAELRDEVSLAGRSDLAVLITGETGVGKEVVARAIHAASARSDRPLIYVNCAALPESIAESELFGHVRGAFTGATEHRAGKFEVADGGSLFLDENGELPLSIQPKLLRALQSGEIQRVGSDKLLRVDVRIIAATNRDLPVEVALGRFRADLFHRLSVYPIRVPALRDHRDDISLLAGFFLDEARMRLGLGRVRLTATAREALERCDWPGNVRELQHTILRAALRASGGRRRELVVIDVPHLGLPPAALPEVLPVVASAPDDLADAHHPRLLLTDAVEQLKRRWILLAVDEAHGNWAEAARMLGLDRGNLHRLAHRLGVAR
ncbi:MAG: nitric oxide reductase transcriptional regulator NorR [Proteobacteria bacterium]|nr:nitric oxide reductase transcriptional regulator NorR [Pseudomonadota bacterium]